MTLVQFDPSMLRNYQQLSAKVAELCGQIEERCREHLACRQGCDSCCRHLSLFWVEAVALAWALKQVAPALAQTIRGQARHGTPDGPCPLLLGGGCLLYAARPLICRTHGLPLLLERDGKRRIDYCPLNFQQAATLPPGALVNLETLNATLAAVNALFVQELFGAAGPPVERLSIGEALLLEV
ncbi:MAG: YkgJ family cysteine cluster protein [Trichloromonadaceae bacterium]